ncbi:MAG: hypothetical protein K8F52_06340 [Candidatus Scalindua rubra]|uniref:Uncharacterized protein n=1 Tax=Candidatus Scalindua brodae TaxID=237368 RepID=A0A0B0EL46_9BACT|nr:MAG: hypothetical protein SCABRO_02888 [Candidatus Scalindua brodae]MBZ0108268.1 hypothetical protein [Candidatus Scalindua rubra]
MNVFRMKCISFVFISIFILSFSLLPKSAYATDIVFTDFQAEMLPTLDNVGNETHISLLVNSTKFGPGGFAGGTATIGVAPPDDGIVWYVEAPVGASPPDDGTPAVRFRVDENGIIDPDIIQIDFRLLVGIINPEVIVNPDVIPIGQLDFSAITGQRGSITLSNLIVKAVDATGTLTGEVYDVPDLTITDLPTSELVEVDIDIKPRRWPNKLHIKCGNIHGRLRVAILGTQNFDVNRIDINSVRLKCNPVTEGVKHKKHRIKDVASLPTFSGFCEGNVTEPDSYKDLVLKYRKKDVVEDIDVQQLYDGNTIKCTIDGNLTDGTAFEGADCVLLRVKECSDDDSSSCDE